MDEALEKALEFANFSATLNNQKKILTQKYQDDLVLYHLGGRFTVTKEFFSFVSNLVLLEVPQTVIIDDNNTPVLVEDLKGFMNLVKQQYATASNRYLSEYKKLTVKRSVEGLVDG
jgi:hypothetical protein